MSNSNELNHIDDSQDSAISNTPIDNIIDDDVNSLPPLSAPTLMRSMTISMPYSPSGAVGGSPRAVNPPNNFQIPVLIRQANDPINYGNFDDLINGLNPNAMALGNIMPFPPFPPFPPVGLQRMTSAPDPDFDRYVQETYDTYETYNAPLCSKLQLVKEPIITFLSALKMVSPKSIVSLIAYDDHTTVYNGTIDEIIRHVNALHTRGSTDFVQMINKLKEELANSNPEFEKFIFGLTDGMHNVGRSVQEILNDESTYNIFNMTLGIGSQHDVQHDLLKHLSGNSDDKYHLTKNAADIEDIINGGCFEGVLAKNIHQATFELLFENSSDVCVLGEDSRSEMTRQEYLTYLDSIRDIPSNKNIKCNEVCPNHFVVSVSDNKLEIIDEPNMSKLKDKQIHFFICVDISGSMNDMIYSQHQTMNHITNHQPVMRTSSHVPFVHNQVDTIPETEAEIEAETEAEIEAETETVDLTNLTNTELTDHDNRVMKKQKHTDTKSYLKISLKEMSTITDATNLIFRGKLLHMSIKYTQSNGSKYHDIIYSNISEIPDVDNLDISDAVVETGITPAPDMTNSIISVKTNSSDNLNGSDSSDDSDNSLDDKSAKFTDADVIIRYVNIMAKLEEINKIPKLKKNFPQIKTSIQELYKSNMDFISIGSGSDISSFLKNVCSTIWNIIERRFRATLSHGAEFIEFGNIDATPSILSRAVSAGISATVSNSCSANRAYTQYDYDSTNMCKICFTNPIDMIFVQCSHAGTCTKCVEIEIDLKSTSDKLYKCPFCRADVNSWIKIDHKIEPICQGPMIQGLEDNCCHSVVKYYCDNKHPMHCKSCIKKVSNPDKSHEYFCKKCDSFRPVMKVKFM